MKDSELNEHLETPANRSEFVRKRTAWCEERRNGKRRRTNGDCDQLTVLFLGMLLFDNVSFVIFHHTRLWEPNRIVVKTTIQIFIIVIVSKFKETFFKNSLLHKQNINYQLIYSSYGYDFIKSYDHII